MDQQQRLAQLQRAALGDSDALQRLIVTYHDALRAAVAGRMAAALRRHLDPDDVLQEAYIAAFQGIDGCRFDDPARFYRWLERIAVNKLKDLAKALRRQKRNPGGQRRDPGGMGGGGDAAATSYLALAARASVSESTPSRCLGQHEAVAALLSSLARLTDEQREVIRLRFLEGRSVADIAEQLGKTAGAVHMLCHRGLRTLEDLMGSITAYLSRV